MAGSNLREQIGYNTQRETWQGYVDDSQGLIDEIDPTGYNTHNQELDNLAIITDTFEDTLGDIAAITDTFEDTLGDIAAITDTFEDSLGDLTTAENRLKSDANGYQRVVPY